VAYEKYVVDAAVLPAKHSLGSCNAIGQLRRSRSKGLVNLVPIGGGENISEREP
jgi:hypothetical protein